MDDAVLIAPTTRRRHTNVGTQWYIDELRHRQIARQTKTLVVLTVIVGVLTAVNVVAVLAALAEG